jgi:hypothetical protein
MKVARVKLRVTYVLNDTDKVHEHHVDSLQEAYVFKAGLIRDDTARKIDIQALYPFFEQFLSLKDVVEAIRTYKNQSIVH